MNALRILFLIAFTISIAIVAPLASGYSQGNDLDASGRAAVIASEANLDSFSFYKCQFVVTCADAESVDHALRGEYTNVRSCEYLLVVDGHKEKYQTLSEIAIPELPKNAKAVPQGGLAYLHADFTPKSYTRSNTHGICYIAPFGNAHVHGPDFMMELSGDVPLSMGVMGNRRINSPANILHRAAADNIKFIPKGHEVVDGRPVVFCLSRKWKNARFGLV